MSKYDIAGEDGTGFEHYDDRGPFQCGNCAHMQQDGEGNGCMHPVMVRISKLERNRENYPIVGKRDHCMFVKRPPKK